MEEHPLLPATNKHHQVWSDQPRYSGSRWQPPTSVRTQHVHVLPARRHRVHDRPHHEHHNTNSAPPVQCTDERQTQSLVGRFQPAWLETRKQEGEQLVAEHLRNTSLSLPLGEPSPACFAARPDVATAAHRRQSQPAQRPSAQRACSSPDGPEKLVCEAVCESFSGHRNGHIKHQFSARINACSGKLHPFPFSSELLCSFPFLFFQAAGDARPGRSKNLWLQAISQSPRLCVPDFSCVSLLGVVALILM